MGAKPPHNATPQLVERSVDNNLVSGHMTVSTRVTVSAVVWPFLCGLRRATAGAPQRAVAVVVGLGLAALLNGAALGTERPGDAIWEVSSRGLPDCPNPFTVPTFAVQQHVGGCWWSQSQQGLVEHLMSHPEQRVVIYVHGNWMPHPEARQRALTVYRHLVCTVSSGPICFIAYSWPSERQGRLARDVEEKKTRLDADAFYFASLIRDLPLVHPIGYIGYSFGAAVVCGAQHLLAGGQLCQYHLPGGPNSPLPAHISLIAPAFDRQSLTSRGRYRLAIDEGDSLVNVYNSMDPILKRFRFFDRDSSPIAAGFMGLSEPRIGTPLSVDITVEQYDCCDIGRTHAELDYLRCRYMTRVFQNALGMLQDGSVVGGG